LLLTLPFQGFAAATMLPCAPAMPAHDHAAMMHHGADMRHDPGTLHHEAKCGNCAACCPGAAMAPASPLNPPLAPAPLAFTPFAPGHLQSVDPSLPERPPRTSRA
jgi:hypothetical protein